MLAVKTRIGKSKIHGIGLFACNPIRKGTAVWNFTPGLDLAVSQQMIARMNVELREFFHHYGYLSAKSGRYVLHADNARFINHSTNANLQSVPSMGEEEEIDVAARDIPAGEELTADYWQFDLDAPLKLESKPREAPPLPQAA